jgi:hypothetical protein
VCSHVGDRGSASLWDTTIGLNLGAYAVGAAHAQATGELSHEKGSQARHSAGAAENAGGGHVIGGKRRDTAIHTINFHELTASHYVRAIKLFQCALTVRHRQTQPAG